MEHKLVILVVDDQEANVRLLQIALEPQGYEVLCAYDGRQALERAQEKKVDLILLDIMMPGMDGAEVKRKLNENLSTADIPVIFVTGRDSVADKVEGFNLKADDYVTKPFEPEELLARIRTVLERKKHYEKISMTDALTGLPNIHVYERQLKHLFQVAKRYRRTFSMGVVDIDNLKRINDSYGHLGGDFAIRCVAEAMLNTFRKADIVVRYGGDEFVIFFPESDEHQASTAMGRLKDQVNGREFTMSDGARIPVFVSTGVAMFQESFQSEQEIFEAADKNMYAEKSAKRAIARD